MARRRKSISNGMLALIALVVFGVSGTAMYLYTNSTGGTGQSGIHTRKPAPPRVTVTEEARKVTIYVPEYSSNTSFLTPVTRTTESKDDILDAAMEALIATSKEPGDTGGLIPKDTRMLSPVKVSDGVATVNLSGDFITNFSGGSEQEALTLNAIAHTLVKNGGSKVKRVRILIEGEPADTLGGHFEITEPMTPDSAMLKPGS